MFSVLPKQSSRSPSSRTLVSAGLGNTEVPRCRVSTCRSFASSPESSMDWPTQPEPACTVISPTPYPVDTARRWRTSMSGKPAWSAT